jgi:hypothetical protein
MLSMAKAIRNAPCKLWGHLPVPKKYVVLYLTPEVGDRPINHRLEKLGLQNDEGFLFRTLSMGANVLLDNKELIAAADGKVIFLDTLVRWLKGRDENNATEMSQLFDLIQALIAAGAVAVVFAHHSVKGNKKMPFTMTMDCVFRGSGDIAAVLSAGHGIYQMDKPEKDKTLIHIECVKPKDFEPLHPFQLRGKPYIDTEKDFRMEKPPGTCGYFDGERTDKKAEGTVDPRVAKIREMLAAEKTREEIAAHFGVSTKTIQRILNPKKKAKELEDQNEEPTDQIELPAEDSPF